MRRSSAVRQRQGGRSAGRRRVPAEEPTSDYRRVAGGRLAGPASRDWRTTKIFEMARRSCHCRGKRTKTRKKNTREKISQPSHREVKAAKSLRISSENER
jgi:hypothetical protein